MATTQSILAEAPLFSHLSEQAREVMTRSMRERTFAAGSDIVTEGESGIGFFVILEGTAAAVHEGEDGARATLGPGASFGEIALLDGGPRTATVRAMTDVRCSILTRWDFLATLRDQSDLAVELLSVLSRRIRELEQRISRLEAAGARG